MKVLKVGCNKKILEQNPQKSFQLFSERILKGVKRNQIIPTGSFAYELKDLGDVFSERGQKNEMNKVSKKLAETLVSLKNNELASVVYSFLVKFNVDNPKLAEEIATNGLAVARRLKDDVHIVARCHDLRSIYKSNSSNAEKMLKVMYEEKRALNNIVKNYDGAKERFNTISRDMKPKENYEIMLGNLKLDIAILLSEKEPKTAIIELKEAREIFEKLGNQEKVIGKINALLKNLQ